MCKCNGIKLKRNTCVRWEQLWLPKLDGGSWFLSSDLVVGVVLGDTLDFLACVDAASSPSSNFFLSEMDSLLPEPDLLPLPDLFSSSSSLLSGLFGVSGGVLALVTESLLLVEEVDPVILGRLTDSDDWSPKLPAPSEFREPEDRLTADFINELLVPLTRGFLGGGGWYLAGNLSDLLLAPTGLGLARVDGFTPPKSDKASMTSLTNEVFSSLSDLDLVSLTSGGILSELSAGRLLIPGLTGAEVDIVLLVVVETRSR